MHLKSQSLFYSKKNLLNPPKINFCRKKIGAVRKNTGTGSKNDPISVKFSFRKKPNPDRKPQKRDFFSTENCHRVNYFWISVFFSGVDLNELLPQVVRHLTDSLVMRQNRVETKWGFLTVKISTYPFEFNNTFNLNFALTFNIVHMTYSTCITALLPE